MIAVSVVSHGHGLMLGRLVEALLGFPDVKQILITRNIPEPLHLPSSPRIAIIDNPSPKGFGANHNAAFGYCHQPYFAPLNPDIEFYEDPFPKLLLAMEEAEVALVAPMVKAPDGLIENSVRYFPTLPSLIRKVLGGDDGRYRFDSGHANFYPEWVAGMFMLFRSQEFSRLSGFDEKFFLYYEDVDICVRTWKKNMKVKVCPEVGVVHHARRDSHVHFRYLRWHLASMARFFLKHWGRLPHVV